VTTSDNYRFSPWGGAEYRSFGFVTCDLFGGKSFLQRKETACRTAASGPVAFVVIIAVITCPLTCQVVGSAVIRKRLVYEAFDQPFDKKL